ncbi:MAG: tRNA (N6-isopentenyl adenosine(37)-C2)-methylthiotransferase MiaB [Bacilli bacterium]|nr:tRNA (N6-isopentenyl adenosine(37)-C2)-methylthiotransferase MiaB [Bacilli bacterium]
MNLPDYVEARRRTKSKVDIEMYSNDIKGIGIGKTYHIKTYGCQMNEHDSENIKAILEELGFTYCEDYESSDLVLLNTCSIRENAHNKAFGMLGRLKHLKESSNPNLIVGLCGCMAQEEGVVKEIISKYKWVNFVFGTHNLHRLPYLLNENFKSNKSEIEVFSYEGNIIEGMPVKRDSKYKAFVNIIYGCDKFCTYCIVPFTRGKQRSRLKEDIISEVEQLVRDGYQEVTLLGQNVNAYGKDLELGYGMEELLEEVSKTNIPRIRFVTSHPWDFTDGMIDVIAKHKNIMPAIHLPVQSGSSSVLKLMGRRYSKEDYLTLFSKIKEKIPNVSISTDIIVGFPSETEEDFKETVELCHFCKFDNAFTFIYSPRENTAAAKLKDDTPLRVKEQRLNQLNDVVNKYFLENNKKLIGEYVPVLVEGISDKKNELYGYTDTNKLINFKGDESLIGKIVRVKVTDAKTWSLDGELDER